MKRIYIVGTADTKGEEMLYIRDLVAASGAGDPWLVDVSTRPSTMIADTSPESVASFHPRGQEAVLGGHDRGFAVAAMADAFALFLPSRQDLAGVIAIGGGGGTAIATAGMRALPLGVPKLMVSTLASGDVAPYVDVSDITMMASVTDLAGLNRLSRIILHNAAQAIAGMVARRAPEPPSGPAVGLTMFGVTTACVSAIATALGPEIETMVFHATGTGGRAMEKLVASGMLGGLIDITTTEIADLLVGGVLPAREERLDVLATTKVPYVGSVGALDMVNFWAPDTVPPRFSGRLFYHHNSNVTLMRTTAEECRRAGAFIASKLNACDGKVRFLIPEKGISALDMAGGPFHDPDADEALFDAIEQGVRWTESRQLRRLPFHINDPAFAAAAVSAYREIA